MNPLDKAISKLRQFPFLIEMTQTHYIVVIVNRQGKIVWTLMTQNNQHYEDAKNLLFGKPVHELYHVEKSLFSKSDKSIPDLQALKAHYKTCNPNDMESLITTLPIHPSRNIFEYLVEDFKVISSVPLSSIRLLRIDSGYLLGIIYFNSIIRYIARWNNDLNIIIDEKGSLMGYDENFKQEAKTDNIKLGEPIGHYIDTEFMKQPVKFTDPLKNGKRVFEYSKDKKIKIENYPPKTCQKGPAGELLMKAGPKGSSFILLPVKINLQEWDIRLSVSFSEVMGELPFIILHAEKISGFNFPDSFGLTFIPSPLRVQKNADKKKKPMAIKRRGEVARLIQSPVLDKLNSRDEIKYTIVKSGQDVAFFINNTLLSIYPSEDIPHKPGCEFMAMGIRAKNQCAIHSISLEQFDLTQGIAAKSRDLTFFRNQPEKFYKVNSMYLPVYRSTKLPLNYLRLEDLEAREQIRLLMEETKKREAEIRRLKNTMLKPRGLDRIVGTSPVMVRIKSTLSSIAQTDASVLFTGETGTGKSMIAEALHEISSRKKGPFVKVDCAALPKSLIESELFGFEKGAFTGADKVYQGKFEQADKGTLFLDEIGNIDPPLQAKLLNVLQDRTLYRIGGNKAIPLDVRIIAATNTNLEERIQKGEFRKDLFYRLNVITINIPPLRERIVDIAILCDYFFNVEFQKHDFAAQRIDPEVYDHLMKRPWHGNVRELYNVLLESLILSKSKVLKPREIIMPGQPDTEAQKKVSLPDKRYYKRVPIEKIVEEIRACGGNISQASDRLGIARLTIYKKLRKAGIDLEGLKE
jgi:transcriptional regulator with PAS, ATPase and Fis domain